MQRFHFIFPHSLVLILLCASFEVHARQRESTISLGSSLTPTKNSSWLSSSGLYAFGFYQQEKGWGVGVFIAGIPEKTVVWTANRDNPTVSSNATLLLSTEGRLVLQSPQDPDTNIADSSPASNASMLNSGNFVLYNSSGGIIWQSFDHPTDTILPTQRLQAGKELYSSASATDHSTGRFRLKMQNDGNLVQYPNDIGNSDTAPYSYWSSFTDGKGDNVALNLDADGHLYLLNATGFNIKNITNGYPTRGVNYFMKVDWDGIFRLYSHNLSQSRSLEIVWESSGNKCAPKGLCGLNMFCVTNDTLPDCKCLPEFSPVSPGNWTAGCERNFTAASCSNSHQNVTIEAEYNTAWEDDSYKILSETTQEDCEAACLADCNCEVALFRSNQCMMQRLPLRFGRRDTDTNSNYVTLVKVDAGSSTHSSVPTVDRKDNRTDIKVVISLCAGFLFIILTVLGVFMYRYHVWYYTRISGNGFSEDIAPKSFSYAEIVKLTDNFKEEIGRGSSGTVFKGTMMDCQKFAAVKRLERLLDEGEREFLTEVKAIGRTNHRNLVRLLGYCFDGSNKVLVYEYMSNGSLADTLFKPENQPNWVQRMDIARNIARGILYLHDECETQIIHCDIKPQNILMDDYKCAKISDFGLAKLLKPDQTNTFTAIRGTRGYVAPEWHRNLPITVKADVYSFGVVLLEIICRRKSMDQNLPEDEVILEDWVYQCFDTGELSQLVGDEEVDLQQLERMIKVAIWCILDEPSLRPSMKKVLHMLEGTVEIRMPPNPTSYLSCI